MNKIRRKKLAKIKEKITDLKYELEEIKEEEQDCFDNLPYSLQASSKGEEMDENIYYLDNTMEILENALDELDNIDTEE